MGPVSARRNVMAPEYRRIGGQGLSWERGLGAGLSYGLRRTTIRRGTHTLHRGKEMGFFKNQLRNTCALATLVLACTPPDRPARFPEPLPEELLSYLGADSTRALFLDEGLSYHFVWSEKGPWAVHVLRLDLERCDLGLRVLPAGEIESYGAGLATVTELVGDAGAGVLAAVNGDFFTPEGRPLGPEVAAGRVLWSSQRPALEWTPGRAPWIGTVQREGSGLSAGAWVSRDSAGSDPVGRGVPGTIGCRGLAHERQLGLGSRLCVVTAPSNRHSLRSRGPTALGPGRGRAPGVLLVGNDPGRDDGHSCSDRCGRGAQSGRGRFVRDGRPWTNNEPPVRRGGRAGRAERVGGRERPGLLPGRSLILLNRSGDSAALNSRAPRRADRSRR